MKLPAYIRENIPLSGLTTFRIGGPARWLAEPASRHELRQTLELAREWGTSLRILGGGSNLLVADSGMNAMVVRLAHEGEFSELNVNNEHPLVWRSGAAVPLQALVGATARQGVAGLESLASIPGSVGGAATMNAGASEGGLGRFVTEAEMFYPDGSSRMVPADELGFRYRGSDFGGGIAAAFVLMFKERGGPDDVLERMRGYRERKRAAQPLNLPSAGCIFKNPDKAAAGALLDAAGCKGMTEGAAEVSRLHANFIVNKGGAGSGDVAALAARMRKMVLDSSGILLEPEIALWGSDKAFEAFHEVGNGNR